MSKKPLERRIYKNASIIEAALDLKFDPAEYEAKSGRVQSHIYVEPSSEYDYECPPPKETYKIKVRISKVTNGKPSL